jgi:hypothetical protein
MLVAYLIPGLSLLMNKRRTLGLLLLVLQPTILGWLVGAFIARKNLLLQRYRRRRHREVDAQWMGIVAEMG